MIIPDKVCKGYCCKAGHLVVMLSLFGSFLEAAFLRKSFIISDWRGQFQSDKFWNRFELVHNFHRLDFRFLKSIMVSRD